MKNILVVNSLNKFDQSLFSLFSDLNQGDPLFCWLRDNSSLERFKTLGPVKKIFIGPRTEGLITFFLFAFLLPFFWLSNLFILYFFWRKQKIEKIICIGFSEKIIFTPLARFLKIAVIWFELPGAEKRGKVSSWFLKFFSASTEIISFTTSDSAALIEAGFKKEKINNISLGINLNTEDRQDNIFYSLAKADKPYSFYKNFTVGAVIGPADRRRLELLLQAGKSCLNFIPNLRLVIIGSTPENNNLNWLVKKMGMETRVWFVGEQKKQLQWFADFDLYVFLQSNPSLGDLETALLAAYQGVPLVAFQEKNMSDIIIEGQTGFFVVKDSAEALSQKIIEIEADQGLCRLVGGNGKKMVHEHFDREKQIKRLEEIIGKKAIK